MVKQINKKCFDCAHQQKPVAECYILKKCSRKRSYYRNLDKNRQTQRNNHRYIRFCADVCLLCGSKQQLEVHHIIPQSRGGTDDWNNVVTLCQEHHKIITSYYKSIGWDNPLWYKFVYGGYKKQA